MIIVHDFLNVLLVPYVENVEVEISILAQFHNSDIGDTQRMCIHRQLEFRFLELVVRLPIDARDVPFLFRDSESLPVYQPFLSVYRTHQVRRSLVS